MKSIIIIGTGLAGYNLAREFRKLDSETPLHLYSKDGGNFYSKPLLSNALANGKTPESLIVASAEQMSRQLNATIHTGTTVTAIDAGARHIIVDGKNVPYEKLVLALGAEPLLPPLQGDAAAEVFSINNLDDYTRFRKAIAHISKIAIIGPGLIGCEFANDLANAGKHVTVIGPDVAPLGRLLPVEAGHLLQLALAQIGITWHLGVVTDEVNHDSNGLSLRLADGKKIDTDIVLAAVGLRPSLQLATQAGLRTERGIVVNGTLQTSAEHIFALGDCMEVAGMVLPFVMPIMHCVRALAKTLAGQPTTLHYPVMPVIVKTPAHPVVVALPSSLAQGDWQVDTLDGSVHAEFRDHNNTLLGFVLTGTAIADKQKLLNDLPPLLPLEDSPTF